MQFQPDPDPNCPTDPDPRAGYESGVLVPFDLRSRAAFLYAGLPKLDVVDHRKVLVDRAVGPGVLASELVQIVQMLHCSAASHGTLELYQTVQRSDADQCAL